MRSKLLDENDGRRTFAVILQTGDEVVAALTNFATREAMKAARISAIGALSHGELAFFDWETKTYRPIAVNEQVEVASLLGDVAVGENATPNVHIHCVLGRRDGSALAGHLIAAHVRPTLEVMITESPSHLRKVKDPESGLALIDIMR